MSHKIMFYKPASEYLYFLVKYNYYQHNIKYDINAIAEKDMIKRKKKKIKKKDISKNDITN